MFGWLKGQEQQITEEHIYYGDVEVMVAEAHDSGASKIELIPIPESVVPWDNSKGEMALEYTLKVTR